MSNCNIKKYEITELDSTYSFGQIVKVFKMFLEKDLTLDTLTITFKNVDDYSERVFFAVANNWNSERMKKFVRESIKQTNLLINDSDLKYLLKEVFKNKTGLVIEYSNKNFKLFYEK